MDKICVLSLAGPRNRCIITLLTDPPTNKYWLYPSVFLSLLLLQHYFGLVYQYLSTKISLQSVVSENEMLVLHIMLSLGSLQVISCESVQVHMHGVVYSV